MKRSVFAGAVGAVVMAALAGAAQAQIAVRPGQVVERIGPADIEWLITQGGHAVTGRPGPLHLEADTTDGFKFGVVGEACEGEGKAARCEGMTVIATWTLKAGEADKLAAMMTRFGFEYPAAKVMMIDGSAALERYVILTGGVTVENLTTELEVFLMLSDLFWVEVDKALGL